MVSGHWIGKGRKGSDRYAIWGAVPKFAWWGWRKSLNSFQVSLPSGRDQTLAFLKCKSGTLTFASASSFRTSVFYFKVKRDCPFFSIGRCIWLYVNSEIAQKFVHPADTSIISFIVVVTVCFGFEGGSQSLTEPLCNEIMSEMKCNWKMPLSVQEKYSFERLGTYIARTQRVRLYCVMCLFHETKVDFTLTESNVCVCGGGMCVGWVGGCTNWRHYVDWKQASDMRFFSWTRSIRFWYLMSSKWIERGSNTPGGKALYSLTLTSHICVMTWAWFAVSRLLWQICVHVLNTFRCQWLLCVFQIKQVRK